MSHKKGDNMEKKDLRVIKTEHALRDALLVLGNNKDFDEITIHEICEKALVRRSTFYRHYEDKFDFYQSTIIHLLNKYNDKNNENYNKHHPETFYAAMINDVLLFLDQNKYLAKSVIRSEIYGMISTIIYKQLYLIIENHLNREIQNGYVFNLDICLLAEFSAGGIMRIIFNWLQSGGKDVEKLSRSLEDMLNQFWEKMKYQKNFNTREG